MVELANGGFASCIGRTHARVTMNGWISDVHAYIVPLSDDNLVILGRSWLRNNNPNVNWEDRTMIITRGDG